VTVLLYLYIYIYIYIIIFFIFFLDCDASFPDSKEGRKKHNLGLVHQRMKEAHFKQFTGIHDILIEREENPNSLLSN
jgi:hypothetical protein